MEYINKLFNRNKQIIKLSDLKAINTLLKTGLPINECFKLIRNAKNQDVFDSVTNKLKQGIMIEEAIKDHLPNNIAGYCIPLLKSMDFSKSLDLSISFCDKVNSNSKTIEKSILYPFVLLFISLSALYLFDTYGLDSILNMLRSFNTNASGIHAFRILLRIIVYVFYFGMLIITLLVLYFTSKKNITLFYIFVSKYFKDSLIQIYYCQEFISLFLICTKLGYKTIDALNILKALHNKPIISFLAFHLDERLLNGDSLKEATKQDYYDSTLTNFINISMYANDNLTIFKDYIELSTYKITSSMKLLTNIIQAGSYALIGGVIIFIYQILFLPMKAIANF